MEVNMLSVWEKLFDYSDFFGDSWLVPFGTFLKTSKDGSLVTTVDMPGVTEKDISVEVSPQRYVTVSGKNATETSSFYVTKSFSVPENYNLDEVKAELKDGALTLTVPTLALPPAKESKKIPVLVK